MTSLLIRDGGEFSTTQDAYQRLIKLRAEHANSDYTQIEIKLKVADVALAILLPLKDFEHEEKDDLKIYFFERLVKMRSSSPIETVSRLPDAVVFSYEMSAESEKVANDLNTELLTIYNNVFVENPTGFDTKITGASNGLIPKAKWTDGFLFGKI